MHSLLKTIVESPLLHAKWLNTLSYLENCGARKIASCEHPTQVKEEMLKHAAEEFRHAHYLKRQIARVTDDTLPDYCLSNILGGVFTKYYLTLLDAWTVLYLKQQGLSYNAIREAAYLLVTYAIELRAERLYTAYDAVLREASSKVTVKSIFLEEKEHLEEMQRGLQELPFGIAYASQIIAYEDKLFQNWFTAVSRDCHPDPKTYSTLVEAVLADLPERR